VHDAVLVEGSTEAIEDIVAKTQEILAEASKIVLGGFTLRSDANIVRYPDRYMDERGVVTWDEVVRLLDEIEIEGTVPD
jgi:precorrin-6B methylase 2